MKTAAPVCALYARVSSDQQAREHTVDSQLHAIRQRAHADGFDVPDHLRFVDEGVSGTTLLRPALERLRDQIAAGTVERLYVHAPDRLARKYAYQVLLLDEFKRAGVEVVFLNRPPGDSPEEDLLLQMQGMIAEYERAKILERSRRGKLQAARRGSVNVLQRAPYGYRYIDRHQGDGQAALLVHEPEAQVVRAIFHWVAAEQCTIGEVCRRLSRDGIPSPKGQPEWSRSSIASLLRNSTYQGVAKYGKTRVCERKPRLRPAKGQPAQPRRPYCTRRTTAAEQISIPTPALVTPEQFAAVDAQLSENQQRHRLGKRGATYLLQGLVVCAQCGHAFYGKPVTSVYKGRRSHYAYYRCVGCEPYRFGGEKLCHNRQVRTDKLEQAVWADVRSLLEDDRRIQEEVTRRTAPSAQQTQESGRLTDETRRTRSALSRVIDAYENGILERADFEMRVGRLRTRLESLEAKSQEAVTAEREAARASDQLGEFRTFAERVRASLAEANWSVQRDIIRAMVKRIEIDAGEVRIVYRIPPHPFTEGTRADPEPLPDCPGGAHSSPPTK